MPKTTPKPRRQYPARPRGTLEQFFIAQWAAIVEKVYGPLRRQQARQNAFIEQDQVAGTHALFGSGPRLFELIRLPHREGLAT